VKIDRVRFLWSAGCLALLLSAVSATSPANAPSASSARALDKPKVLRFTGIPNNNTSELEAKYKPLAK